MASGRPPSPQHRRSAQPWTPARPPATTACSRSAGAHSARAFRGPAAPCSGEVWREDLLPKTDRRSLVDEHRGPPAIGGHWERRGGSAAVEGDAPQSCGRQEGGYGEAQRLDRLSVSQECLGKSDRRRSKENLSAQRQRVTLGWISQPESMIVTTLPFDFTERRSMILAISKVWKTTVSLTHRITTPIH
jgi:hypothetical protein